LLPNGGLGMVNNIGSVDRTIAGVEYHRVARIEKGVLTAETSSRAIAREFAAKDAAAAQAALRELAAQQPLLGYNNNYQKTRQEREAALSDPKSASDYNERAYARLNKQDLAGALSDVDQALKLGPDIPGPYVMRGMVRAVQGKPDEALADVRKGVSLAPEWAFGHLRLASLLLYLNRTDEALAEVDRATGLDPQNAEPLMLRAAIHRKQGHSDQALADSNAALKLMPGNPAIYQMRANIYFAQQQPDKALAEAKAAVAADPKSDEALIFLGAVYARLGQTPQAMAEFAKALAIKPSIQAYLTRANSRPAADLAGKRADVAAALKLEPGSPDARGMTLGIEMTARDYPAAIKAATSILTSSPNDPNALITRGLAYAKLKRVAEARKDFESARNLTRDNAQGLNNLCYGMAVQNIQLDQALADCDVALRLSPKAANILDSRAFVLLRLGRNQEAVDSYDAALVLRPDIAESLYGRGLAKRRLGKASAGDSDVAAAKAIDANVEKEFAGYGVTN
ncbi:MAG TPA: tetratricopeptide repeat protein, partial [Sphingomonas sp.]|nr:tetratricopeptide repeat protein [Sphingomonas sp.]